MEMLTNTNFKLVDKTKYAFVLSALLILAGVTSLILHGGPHLGIDFTGGTILQVRILPAPDLAQVRSLLEDAGFAGVQVQDFGSTDELLITFADIESGELDAAEEMKKVLDEGMPESTVEMRREESVGPKIGGELKTAAMNSVVAALVLIVLYITVRFVFRYGIAAIIALVHDVVITLGVFSLLNKEITLSIIAAFLTIIGYSLNDTIVVFDRIRENMKLRRRESYKEVINRSINETLSRTIVTSLTTLFVAGSLYALGGAVIHDFAFALSFGVIVGTYSSIFIASPVLVLWNQRYISDPRRQRQTM
ncbi:protein translocase subunit SecF [bacterium]|nr:protein translocase subunit SecF [bacterium]MBU1073741.1 protein translocase subunit SecF [bacterium]MBU1676700.1 protein translocase subunit SecF [bacterium]